jgi:hypothetical protein
VQRRPFWERRGCQSGGSVRERWRRRCPVWLPGKDEGRVADRVGSPISEGRRRGRLGQKGEEERWAAAGPKIRNGPKFKK